MAPALKTGRTVWDWTQIPGKLWHVLKLVKRNCSVCVASFRLMSWTTCLSFPLAIDSAAQEDDMTYPNSNDLFRAAYARIIWEERQRLEQFRNKMRYIRWLQKSGPQLAEIERERAAQAGARSVA